MQRKIRSYSNRNRGFSEKEKELFAQLFAKYGVVVSQKMIDFSSLFGNDHVVNFDIGFGMGASILHFAKNHPEENFLGAEVFRDGVFHTLREIDREKITNIRLFHGDVTDLFEFIPDKIFAKVFIFFPDPWPKNRHHRRRLLQKDFFTKMTPKLRDDGLIYFATDDADYAKNAQKEAQLAEVFTMPKVLINERFLFLERPITKYEEKARQEKRDIWEIIWEKK